MRTLAKVTLAYLATALFAVPVWAAIDVTGLTPWACYEFTNGSVANTGSGGREWNSGGSSSSAEGAKGDANTAVSINKWTNTGDVSTVGGLTVSLLATEGTQHSSSDNNGHIFSLAAKGKAGEPQWWFRNTATPGQVKLQGVFTEDLTITLPKGSTDATFHHYVIAISGDRAAAAVYVDGVQVNTAGMTVNPKDSGKGVNDAFLGYQVGARWGGGTGSSCVVDDLRIYTAELKPGQVAALYGSFYSNEVAYTRTISEATANWKEASAWEAGDSSADMPAVGAQATVTAETDTTLTLNDTVAVSQLTLGGTNTVTMTGNTQGVLGSVTTAINTSVDVSGISADLGAVTIAPDKTLTVGGTTVLSDLTFGNGAACLTIVGENWATPVTEVPFGGALRKTGTLVFDCPLTWGTALAFGNGGGATVTQQVTFRKSITATRLITGDGSNNTTQIVQEGGDITLTQENSDIDSGLTGAYAILFGHWPSTSDYQLKAGSLTAEQGYVHLGWDSGSKNTGGATVVVGQSLEEAQGTTALLKVKGFTGNQRDNRATLRVLPSGTLAVGSAGLAVDKSNKHVFLAGGTLLAYENLTTALTANGLEIDASSTVAAATGATLTLDKVVGASDVTLTLGSSENAGTVVLPALTSYSGALNVAAGTVVLLAPPTANNVTVKEGATLKCHVSFEEADAGMTASSVTLENSAKMVFVLPSGIEIEGTGAGGNELEAQSFYTWAPLVDGNWTTLGNWTKSGAPISELPGEDAKVRISLSADTTLTMDCEATVNEAFLHGTGTLTLSGTGKLTAQALYVQTDVMATDTTFAATTVVIDEGHTLALPSGVLPSATYSGAGTLAIVGEVTYAPGASLEGSSLVVSERGTLDLAGQTLDLPLELNGGTLTNSSTDGAVARKVALVANSTLSCAGAITLSSGTGTRNELTLNGHTLTKIGAAGFTVEGVDLDAGTLDIQAGALCLSTNDGGDSVCNGTTLQFAESGTYNFYGWVGLVGTVTVNVEAEKTIALSGNFTFKGSGNLRKTGDGTLEIPFKDNSYAGSTSVEGGHLILNFEPTGTFTRTVSVAAGATFTKKGNGTLKLGSAPSGAGIYEVEGGTIAVGNHAAGDFVGTWKIGTNGTLTNQDCGHYNPFVGNIGRMVVDGLLILSPSSGDSHIFSPISGSGRIHVRRSAHLEGDTAGFTGTLEINSGETLSSLNTVSGYSIVCNGTLNPKDGVTLTIAQGKTLSGAGTIGSALTLAAGATVDASAGALTVTGAVTTPGTVTVRASAPGVALNASGLNASKFTLAADAPENLTLAATETALMVVEVPASDSEATLEPAARVAIAQAAAAQGVTSVISVEGNADAAALFTGVVSVTPSAEGSTEGTAVVAYDFGIASLAIREEEGQQYVVLAAKVQGAEGVDYAEGTEVVVEQNGTSIEAEGMETDPDGVAPAAGVKWFRILYNPATTAPLRFKVKATNATTP